MAVHGPGEGLDLATRRLVARAQSNPEAFGQLYDLYVDRVYAFAVRRLGSRAEAEDVTADTMLAAMANLGRFAWKRGGFGAWVFRIARNRCIDALTNRRRHVPLHADPNPTHETGATHGPEAPDEVLVAREQHELIRSLVARLPDPQREAVLLKYSAGLSNKDIAAVTGRTQTAVSSLLNRSVSKLRKQWGEQYGSRQGQRA